MGPFDANQWYQINLPVFDKRSMVGQRPQPPNTTADVFFKLTDNASNGRHWQLYQVDDTRYILRSKLSNPDTYLTIQKDTSAKGAARGNIATMRDVKGAHQEVFWKITNFKNGGYMLVNVANGTDWHLHAEDPQTVSMTNNITGEQDNQKFQFMPIGRIDNETFSRVQLPSGAYTSLASASSNKSSSGLSHGTKTAIGMSVSVGVGITVGVIVGICFILRRRRKKQAGVTTSTRFDKAELDGTHAHSNKEPVIEHKSGAQELPGRDQVQELDNTERSREQRSPAELPVDGNNNTRYRNQ